MLTAQHLSVGDAITPLHNGDEAYPAMLQAINAAQDQVYLSTYIFNAGASATAFCEALAAAAARGVDVRLLVDGVGQLYSLRRPWKKLARQGVRVAVFLPPRLLPPNLSINLRNHRKLLVCDQTGFTGGMNIADENLTSGKRGYVQDVHFCCQGPIVDQLLPGLSVGLGFLHRAVFAPAAPQHEGQGQ